MANDAPAEDVNVNGAPSTGPANEEPDIPLVAKPAVAEIVQESGAINE